MVCLPHKLHSLNTGVHVVELLFIHLHPFSFIGPRCCQSSSGVDRHAAGREVFFLMADEFIATFRFSYCAAGNGQRVDGTMFL